jgi:hypothetical protein
MTGSIDKKEGGAYDHERVKESFRKANVKNTESNMQTAMGNVKSLRTKMGDGLDMEATTEKYKYMMEMKKSKYLEQIKIMSKIRAEFNPL